MPALRNLDGSVAKFMIDDGEGNQSVGHFEFTIVPSYEPGTRIGDFTFIVDEKTKSSAPSQSRNDLVRQAADQRGLMS